MVNQALRLVTNDDPHGYTRTGNVSFPQLLTLFTTRAKSREQPPLTISPKSTSIYGDDDIDDDKGYGENISDSSVEQLFASFIKAADTTVITAMKKPFLCA